MSSQVNHLFGVLCPNCYLPLALSRHQHSVIAPTAEALAILSDLPV